MDFEPSNDRVIKTYVWHGRDCFFLSTIERSSSAAAAADLRYNETIVWAFDWAKGERGEIVHMGYAGRGSIATHQQLVEAFYRSGKA